MGRIRGKGLSIRSATNFDWEVRKVHKLIVDVARISWRGEVGKDNSAGVREALRINMDGGHARSFAGHLAVTVSERRKLNLIT